MKIMLSDGTCGPKALPLYICSEKKQSETQLIVSRVILLYLIFGHSNIWQFKKYLSFHEKPTKILSLSILILLYKHSTMFYD